MNQSSPMPRILIYQVADSTIMEDYLRLYGFEVISSTSENIKEKAKANNYDLCIIDHYNGLELLNFLRKIDNKLPIIFVSSKYHVEHIIDALNAGADDYVCIPYNLEELVSRIKALLRRMGIRSRGIMDMYEIGKYIFDVKAEMLTVNSASTKLSKKEATILALLCAYKNELLPKKILMQQVWKGDNYYNKRSLDVHMCNLRNYLKQDSRIEIKTVRGMGYSLVIAE